MIKNKTSITHSSKESLNNLPRNSSNPCSKLVGLLTIAKRKRDEHFLHN